MPVQHTYCHQMNYVLVVRKAKPGHLEVSVVHSRHCPYGNEAMYELDSTQCGGPLLHHMHADNVQFSQVECALHGAAHSARSVLVTGKVRTDSPDNHNRCNRCASK